MKHLKIILTIILTILICLSCSQTDTSTDDDKTDGDFDLFAWYGNQNYVSEHNTAVSDAQNQSVGLTKNWWTKTSWYHIWVKSFYDSDGDGCGDIKGVEQKLDYIQNNVGCDGIWLSPIFECYGKSKEIGVNMHGYDTTDYYKVNDYFGTEDDVVSLIKACHNRGMKIIFDFVPNHTGLNCQWFLDSAEGKNDKSTWYLWSRRDLSWSNGMGTSKTWFKNDTNGKYFYGAFGNQMPDLNYRNYEVREEMKNVVRYWLNKGFDGLRVDAARYVVEDETKKNDSDSNHQWFKELRKELDKYSSPKFMVGEVWIEGSRDLLNTYFGNDDEFNMILDFNQGTELIESVSKKKDMIEGVYPKNISLSQSYGVFLSNHDEYNDRPGYTLGQDYRLVGQTLALNILRPDVPFIYYGNEIGQSNTSYDGDLRLRGPFKWEKAEVQMAKNDSPLAYTKNLLEIRKLYPDVFASGTVTPLSSLSGNGYIGYILENTNTKLLCVYNLTNNPPASKKEQVIFSGVNNYDISKYSCLFGNADVDLEIGSNKNQIIINRLGARAVRVYLLGDDTGSNIWNEELDFDINIAYTPKNDKSKDFYPSSQMFLRGTMNDWGGYEMTKTESGSSTVWTYSWRCPTTARYEFKFCANDGMPWAASWGASGGGNLSEEFTADTTYLFRFDETASANSANGAVYQVTLQ